MATFKEHTYKRRQRLSSLWSLDEIVYGDIGPKIKTNAHNHGFDSHFKKLTASYQDALPQVIDILRPKFKSIMSSHYTDFEDLFDRIDSLIGKVHGVGLLAIYDISLRVGCNLRPRVTPEKYVYTHAGIVEEAAKVLLPNVNFTKHKVEISVFAKDFPHYSAMEIEDILCTCHDKIVKNRKFNWEWLNNMA